MFARVNKNNVPVVALWVTSIIIQLIVITTYWSRDAFSLMLNLTSATTLIPYLFVAAYGLMIAKRGETYDVRPEERQRDLILASLAVALHALHDLRRRPQVHPAVRRPVRAGHGAVRLGAARAGQGRVRQDLGLGHLRRHRGRRDLRHLRSRDRFHQPSNHGNGGHHGRQEAVKAKEVKPARRTSSSACTRKSASCAR